MHVVRQCSAIDLVFRGLSRFGSALPFEKINCFQQFEKRVTDMRRGKLDILNIAENSRLKMGS
jgi:hypothetical protein